jgi:glycosyltransferase involved in cell wall biosynthesis
MKISVLTPTLQRESLIRCCQSIDEQMFPADQWEHIVAIDGRQINWEVMRRASGTNRKIFLCGPYSNYGNGPRHEAWTVAKGDFVLYLDDDNFLADKHVLEDIAATVRGPSFISSDAGPAWYLFPILRFGQKFFNDPPGLCRTDTANMVIRRDIGQWPNGPEYTMDGIFCEHLKANYPYKAFPEFRPIVVMEKANEGR